MFTRSALFLGRIEEGREAEFFEIVETGLVPVWRRMPGALDLRVYRPRRAEAGAPPIVLMQEIDYASMAAVEIAEASPVRAEGAPVVARLMTMFVGELRHVVYERQA
ncbi:hypothetical protein [Aurantimonas sp. Leaf443]|uniref:hypothetical protein n=1 Tax=Aurantimonas sp. Leaf443 TaxID=1736378 RepID=UPI0006FF1E18|nr:hypothetical protein [Aurantimonas sp. Leaf443]KQT84040.1 hypothetical protein ASG48_11730 [Aurantimonas sp. Leaf443]